MSEFEINPYDVPREYFRAQVVFAAKWSEIEDKPLADILQKKTGAYLKIGTWFKIESGIEKAKTLDEVTDLLWEKYKTTDWCLFEPSEYCDEYHFGCFEYDNPFMDDETIRVHFNNMQRGERSSLSSGNLETRKAEAREMFVYIKENCPDAYYVQGCSWLYNIPNYRVVYPPSFTRNMPIVIPENNFDIQRDSVWGQFIDKYGQGKLDVLKKFEERVRVSRSTSELLLAFPYPVLAPHDHIRNFYQFYGL